MRVFGRKTECHQKMRRNLAAILSLLFASSIAWANAALPGFKATKSVPTELGTFRLVGEAREAKIGGDELNKASSDHLTIITEARYRGATNNELQLSSFNWQSDSAAFAHFTSSRSGVAQSSEIAGGPIGTASARIDRGVVFFKGTHSVMVTMTSAGDDNGAAAIELARLFAATLDGGENEVPVLVKHLPHWETAQRTALYATDSAGLAKAVPNQPVLDALNFDGGAEAVAANYGQAQLVIVEFTTPQFSIDNDQRIWTKIAELKEGGQPSPTAYRRVGNYSVFVFNAPDYNTANALVDQVKYEQVVQWLGEDPHLYEKLQRYFTDTSAGVLVAVLKSSGLSLLLCLAAGALIGTMMFRRRRTQRAAAYSDAGGSIRLNLDDLTAPVSGQRLLKSGKASAQHRD